jgi:hypothetical protein
MTTFAPDWAKLQQAAYTVDNWRHANADLHAVIAEYERQRNESVTQATSDAFAKGEKAITRLIDQNKALRDALHTLIVVGDVNNLDEAAYQRLEELVGDLP